MKVTVDHEPVARKLLNEFYVLGGALDFYEENGVLKYAQMLPTGAAGRRCSKILAHVTRGSEDFVYTFVEAWIDRRQLADDVNGGLT